MLQPWTFVVMIKYLKDKLMRSLRDKLRRRSSVELDMDESNHALLSGYLIGSQILRTTEIL
jgi:hypothetical protein